LLVQILANLKIKYIYNKKEKLMTTEESIPTDVNENIQLTLNDLSAMKSIIDIASQRGAFKPNEMMIVGQTYNKLTAFLESAKQQGEKK
jgi:hypothetical protein